MLGHSVLVGNLEVPLAHTRLVGCSGACCQVLENCPNSYCLQAFFFLQEEEEILV